MHTYVTCYRVMSIPHTATKIRQKSFYHLSLRIIGNTTSASTNKLTAEGSVNGAGQKQGCCPDQRAVDESHRGDAELHNNHAMWAEENSDTYMQNKIET